MHYDGTSSTFDNPDLAWDLEAFNERRRARDFVANFESTLCVYSPTVDQIYSSYEVFFPEHTSAAKLVILPDQTAYHDTFNYVVREAVRPTGLYIVPGQLVGSNGLHLANVQPDRSIGKRKIPLEPAMRRIMQNCPKHEPFLPVLAKGDLREFEQSWPVLHLQRVVLSKLEQLSELDRTNLSNVISEKLESLFVAQQNMNVA